MESNIQFPEITKESYANYFLKGIDYTQYKSLMSIDLQSNKDEKIQEYIKLNQSRMSRVEKTYIMSEEMKDQLAGLNQKVYWLVLTEHWCGDASQILPVFNAVSLESQGKIILKLVYRDQHPELMNAHLTGESKSIPKLIQLNKDFIVTGDWGPRPDVAQKMVKTLKSNPITAPNYGNELHLWYAKDKQHTIERELSQLLAKLA